MNKYLIVYDFLFYNLKFKFPGEFLVEKDIISFEEIISEQKIKYSFYNPAIIDESYLNAVMHITNVDETVSPARITTKFSWDPRNIDINNPNKNYDFKGWRQKIIVEFYNENDDIFLDINSDFILEINTKLTEKLNSWLLILQDKLFISDWIFPKFISAKNQFDGSNTIYLDALKMFISHGIKINFFKNETKLAEIPAFKSFMSYESNGKELKLKEDLYNAIDEFSKCIKNKTNYEIQTKNEIILLADHERRLGRYKVALVLSTMAVEISIKNIIEIYGNELHKFILEKREVQLKPSEYLNIVISNILNNKVDIINQFDIDLSKLEKLFEIRNKIAHEGVAYYKSGSGKTKYYLDDKEMNIYFCFAKEFVSEKIPKLIDFIENFISVK